MDVGSCLRDRSTSNTRQNSPISYGQLCGNTYGNKKSPPFIDELKEKQLSVNQESCKKNEKFFQNSSRESTSKVNEASDNLNPDGHFCHILSPYPLAVSVECLPNSDAFALLSKSVRCNRWL